MNIKVNDQIDQKSYKKVVDLLVEYNLSKTEQFKNEINKPIEIIVRNKKMKLLADFMDVRFGEPWKSKLLP